MLTVRAIRIYVDRTRGIRSPNSLCFYLTFPPSGEGSLGYHLILLDRQLNCAMSWKALKLQTLSRRTPCGHIAVSSGLPSASTDETSYSRPRHGPLSSYIYISLPERHARSRRRDFSASPLHGSRVSSTAYAST